MLITILATIVVLGVLIFVHELGHFVTAKMVDIEVPRFSIGLGPRLWGFRWGETEYVISWLPLGGYVRMAGMEEMERLEGGPSEHETAQRASEAAVTDVGLVGEEADGERSRDFDSKSLPARAMVLSAGVLMNVLFAVVAFAVISFAWGVPIEPEARVSNVVEERLPAGMEALAEIPEGARVVAVGDDEVDGWDDVERALLTASPGTIVFRFADAPSIAVELPEDQEARADLFVALEPTIEPRIGEVRPGSPAEAAGLQTDDRIVAVEGSEVESWHELVRRVQERAGDPIDVVVERDGRTETVTVTPEAAQVGADGEEETVGQIGVTLPRRDPGAAGSLAYGVTQTWDWTVLIIGFLGDLITGDASPRNLGGPILIGQVSGEVARAGLAPLLNFMGMFSINLAILNLLPIPLLDGGHLLFLAVEAVRGRRLSLELRMRLSQAGFMIVLAIMVWAIANDVLRLFGL